MPHEPAIDPATVLPILSAARALVEQGWTQEVSARDMNADPVWTHSDDVVCWCLMGAVKKAQAAADILYNPNMAPVWALVTTVTAMSPERAMSLTECNWSEITDALVAYNDDDTNTKEDVLHLLDSTIARVRGNLPLEPIKLPLL